MAILTCNKISFAYENEVVVRDLSFRVEAGDYLCIVGENGSGKTTLIKGLLGLKKPCGGEIVMGEGLKQKEIGYVPQQNPVQMDFPASVYEVVLAGCLNRRGMRPGYSRENKILADEKLKLLAIGDLKHRSYKELSGGQRQRVLLARSLCAAEKLLLLDEPVNGLDPVAAEEFYRMIRELNEKHGMAVIMVSHAIREAVENAGHILHLSHQSYFFGKSGDYRNSEQGKQFTGGGRHA